jgi:hypothetical protein
MEIRIMPVSLSSLYAPTAATVAAAVAAPSAATIAAAVAAPSAATIASAVAAPSSAAIASAVAAAVPTISAINSSVSTNASPYGGTVTNLGYVSGNGVNTVTFSSLTGYKRLVLFWQGIDSSTSANFRVRLNSDTGSNYAQSGMNFFDTYSARYVDVRATSLFLGGMGASANNTDGAGMLELFDSNSGGYKMGSHFSTSRNGYTSQGYDTRFIWTSTSAISTVTIYNDGGNFVTSGTGGFYLKGLS